MRRRLAAVAEWLVIRVAPRVDPAFLAACDRARIERVTGRPLEPAETPHWRELAFAARFEEILNAPAGDVDDAFAVIVSGLKDER